MNNQPEGAFLIPVDFEKMVPAAEGPKRLLCALKIDVSEHSEALEIEAEGLREGLLSNRKARGYLLPRKSGQGAEIRAPLHAELCERDAAAHVDPDEAREEAIAHGHREADRADFSRVGVWHQADFLVPARFARREPFRLAAERGFRRGSGRRRIVSRDRAGALNVEISHDVKKTS